MKGVIAGFTGDPTEVQFGDNGYRTTEARHLHEGGTDPSGIIGVRATAEGSSNEPPRENPQLKRIVADLTLDNTALTVVVSGLELV